MGAQVKTLACNAIFSCVQGERATFEKRLAEASTMSTKRQTMFEVRRAIQRGVAEYGWLSSRHTFSFGNYQDAEQTGFSDLLVINEDRVIGGRGFGQHSHRDMEIFSYVLDGALEHRDSMGTGAVIRPGDVQLMSAGIGVAHSEFNHSATEPVHFLQIWIVPNRRGVAPQYQQAHFSQESKRGRLKMIISPDGEDESLTIHQDVRVYAGLFDCAESHELLLPVRRHLYVHIARGTIFVNGIHLKEGDGLRVRGEPRITFSDGIRAEVLVFDLRAIESPGFPN
jgi:quercetin 2,3-dioxygenase